MNDRDAIPKAKSVAAFSGEMKWRIPPNLIMTSRSGDRVRFTVDDHWAQPGVGGGWRLCDIMAIDCRGGERVGRISLSYIQKALFDASCANPLDFVERYGGFSLGNTELRFGGPDGVPAPIADPARIAADARYRGALASHLLAWEDCSRAARGDLEADEIAVLRDRILDAIGRRFKRKMGQLRAGVVRQPTVDYIEVEKVWRGRGLSYLLYRAAGLQAALNATRVRRSNTLSERAQRITPQRMLMAGVAVEANRRGVFFCERNLARKIDRVAMVADQGPARHFKRAAETAGVPMPRVGNRVKIQ